MRLSDGDDPIGCIRQVAKTEGIESAVVYLVGGLKRGEFVVGPATEQMPPQPLWRSLEESHEVLAVGTLFPDSEGEPLLHLHGAFGKRDDVRVGCLRKDSEVYLVLEVVLLEIKGMSAKREEDPLSGLKLLTFQ